MAKNKVYRKLVQGATVEIIGGEYRGQMAKVIKVIGHPYEPREVKIRITGIAGEPVVRQHDVKVTKSVLRRPSKKVRMVFHCSAQKTTKETAAAESKPTKKKTSSRSKKAAA